jgi:hypothetical protein
MLVEVSALEVTLAKSAGNLSSVSAADQQVTTLASAIVAQYNAMIMVSLVLIRSVHLQCVGRSTARPESSQAMRAVSLAGLFAGVAASGAAEASLLLADRGLYLLLRPQGCRCRLGIGGSCYVLIRTPLPTLHLVAAVVLVIVPLVQSPSEQQYVSVL